MASRACREIGLHIAAWRGERWQTSRQRAMRAVGARERTWPLAGGEPKGRLGRLGVVARGCVVRVRGGRLLIRGHLEAVDGSLGV
jgi:hypothetical protein